MCSLPIGGKAIARQKTSRSGSYQNLEEMAPFPPMKAVSVDRPSTQQRGRGWSSSESPKIIRGNVALRHSHRVPGAVGGHGE